MQLRVRSKAGAVKRVIDGVVFNEPDVTINGVALTFAQAMTLRVMIATSDLAQHDPDYAPHVREIVKLIQRTETRT